MRELIWRIIARIVSRPAVAAWIIERAQRTPYRHLEGYMNRWWLFNPTPPENDGRGRRFEWLPSVRVHHILRADHARDHHNHPWAFRTIVMRGWYVEQREQAMLNGPSWVAFFTRHTGSTATLDADGFHHVSEVSPGGVYTLFISWRWRHVWGFKTADGFVSWRDYPDANP